jgi:hypothetical protein
MERQIHGIEYEKRLCSKHNLIFDENYTAIWDAYKPNGIPCVIKTFKEKSELPLSDIFKNASINGKNYLIGIIMMSLIIGLRI